MSGESKKNSPSNGKPRKVKAPHGVRPGSAHANRIAIAVLEVLAGERTPTDAAQTLGVTVPRYYQLETRAVNGLVAACEPRPKGKQPSPATRISALERQLASAQRETARQQSLVRAAHRSLGVKAAPMARKTEEKKKQPGKRRRKPSVRAMRAVKTLQKSDGLSLGGAVQPAASGEGSVTSSGEA